MRKGFRPTPLGVGGGGNGGGGNGGGIAASCDVAKLVVALLTWQSATMT